ncbi:MAG: hypothetical protein DSY90_12210 [Deltaproteobacteria bacterium]|nr:MAG: hypothetical protein DSY90_12210 [Deltaproteobacteria bacterium]
MNNAARSVRGRADATESGRNQTAARASSAARNCSRKISLPGCRHFRVYQTPFRLVRPPLAVLSADVHKGAGAWQIFTDCFICCFSTMSLVSMSIHGARMVRWLIFPSASEAFFVTHFDVNDRIGNRIID